MTNTQSPPPTKKRFWLSIFIGAGTGFFLCIIFLYINFFDYIISSLGIIPFTAGFVTVTIASTNQKRDRASQIMMPWAAALIIMLLPLYWKLRLLLFLSFPAASLGGVAAGYVYTIIEELRDNFDL